MRSTKCLLGCVLLGLVGFQNVQPTTDLEVHPQNPEIIALLEEIVSLQELRMRELEPVADMATADYLTGISQLTEAKIALAEAQGQYDAVIQELHTFIRSLETQIVPMELKVEVGLLKRSELTDAQVALIKAKIRLIRAKAQLK